MANKNVLNEEDLEKVTGGRIKDCEGGVWKLYGYNNYVIAVVKSEVEAKKYENLYQIGKRGEHFYGGLGGKSWDTYLAGRQDYKKGQKRK